MPPAMNGIQEKMEARETSTPVSSVNNSINSLPGEGATRPDSQWARRERADSDTGVSSILVQRRVHTNLSLFLGTA